MLTRRYFSLGLNYHSWLEWIYIQGVAYPSLWENISALKVKQRSQPWRVSAHTVFLSQLSHWLLGYWTWLFCSHIHSGDMCDSFLILLSLDQPAEFKGTAGRETVFSENSWTDHFLKQAGAGFGTSYASKKKKNSET